MSKQPIFGRRIFGTMTATFGLGVFLIGATVQTVLTGIVLMALGLVIYSPE